MDTRRLSIVELKTGRCPCGNCHLLAEFFRSTPFSNRINVRLGAADEDASGEGPALIVVRCFSDARLRPALRELCARWPRAAFLGAFCDPLDPAVGSMRELTRDLDDFFWCPVRESDFLPRVERLLQQSGVAAPSMTRHSLEAFVGESPLLIKLLEKIPCVAACDATCVISGETGTGKELVARAIHYSSPRQSKPYVPVNCGALPDHLFENEMFGHQRGAYTDASSNESGLLAVAAGGSIFLDEVDSLSPAAQVKLLRFLQDREYRPLGSSRPVKADVRVMAATNADLRKLVELRLFREDLFHRLNVVNLHMPNLRERVEDIPLLANYFVKRYGPQHRPGVAIRLTDRAMQKLVSYSWPGNIRELEAVIQRSIILSRQDMLCAADIELPGVEDPPELAAGFGAAKRQLIGNFERNYLVRLLEESEGNVSRAARSAGKERRAFQRLLQKHNLPRRAMAASA